jgi:hypothetical protein
MKYIFLFISIILIKFENKQTYKLKGLYSYSIKNYSDLETGTITFNDSIYILNTRELLSRNKYIGKVKYGNCILLENFTNPDLIISIRLDEIQKDTISFSVHNRKSAYANYLDISVSNGKMIKLK